MRDNYDAWVEHDREEQDALELLPVCEECGEPIQDEFCYSTVDGYVCEECLNKYYRIRTAYLIG